ncbi:guanylate kinase [Microaerobacter geothermalis]|uniref:guanylate kinase n=1 Tax=Microaerobacter geothermalis TaxID=674972 RepID=UPI001F3D0F56|nr:guanylate kinase [Microaerobacter geothermalis]MCF6094880.1 guanylate kinase [Microaerobacter geothermalis]
MEKERGLLIVLSGPSGVGKGTVRAALQDKVKDLVYSISATTREKREDEVEGVHYFFKTKDEFLQMIENDEFLEWAQFVGNYYGTPRAFVEETLSKGKDVILEIEVKGAFQVQEKFPEGIFIFLAPPNMTELKNRIIHRGTETEESIHNRLNTAREEIEMMEKYDYVVVNDEVDKACERIMAIIVAEHCKRERIIQHYYKLIKEDL